MDVSDTSIQSEPVANQRAAVPVTRHKGEQGWGELGDRLPSQPVLAPEAASSAVTQSPSRRGTEKLARLGIARLLQVVPRAGGVCSLQPQPAGAQGDAGKVQIVLQRAANALPADKAAAGLGILPAVPVEVTNDPS